MRLARICLVALAALTLTARAGAAQELTIGLSANVTSLDPHFHALSPNNSVAAYFFDRLILQDPQSRLIPGLATSWKAIDDTTWEFKLRQGVKFNDGSPFDAEDVLASLKRVPWVPNSPSSFAVYTRPIVETIVVDPHTIRFKTKLPYGLLPQDMANVYIVHRAHVNLPTVEFNGGKGTLGTGPYKFAEYVPGNRIVVQRNDAYWGAKAHWTKVTMRMITSDPARVAALLAGDVQMIEGVPPVDVARLKSTPTVTLSRVVSNRLIYLSMDQFRDEAPHVFDKQGQPLKANPFKDVRVRRAISMAINRSAIVERVMESEAIPAAGMLPPGYYGANPALKPDPYDPQRARALLAEAGYPNGFRATIHGPNDRYVNDEKIIQAIGPMLTRIGIDAQVQALPFAAYAGQSSAPGYAFSLMLWGWGSSEISTFFRALIATVDRERGLGGSNRGRHGNAALDDLVLRANATLDEEKREVMLQEAGRIAAESLALIPLHHQINIWALRKGLSYEARADEYTLAASVRPAP